MVVVVVVAVLLHSWPEALFNFSLHNTRHGLCVCDESQNNLTSRGTGKNAGFKIVKSSYKILIFYQVSDGKKVGLCTTCYYRAFNFTRAK